MRLQLKAVAAGALAVSLTRAAFAQSPDEEPPEPAPHVRDVDVHASSEVAAYADTDHVYVVSPSVSAALSNPIAGWRASGRYLVDVVSAASVDVVSSASRRWEEVRHAGTIDGAYKPGNFGVGATGVVSIEPDYQSYTGGASVTQDLLAKNLTLLFGYSYGHDIAGRSGTPFSVFSRKLDIHGFKGGATILLGSATVLSLVTDFVHEAGDSSKPYRYVPMFAPGTQVPLGASVDQVNQLRLSARVLEQLPLQRDRFALTGRLANRFTEATVRVDERLYVDSWGMKASTTDARLVFDLSRRVEIGPHLRVHAQTSVNFWQRAYVMNPGYDFPALRTGSRELGPLVNLTGGGSFRWGIGPSEEPRSWMLGFDLAITSTHYLDDLFLKQRWSSIGAASLEVDF